MLRVLICGAGGNMGKQVIKGIAREEDFSIVGGVDPAAGVGEDLGELAGIKPIGQTVLPSVDQRLAQQQVDIAIDFTYAEAAMENARKLLPHGSDMVIGTTGFSSRDLEELRGLSADTGRAVLVAPNFSIGALLLIKFAGLAAQYLPDSEVVEMHRSEKRDAPSGTALRIAEAIAGEMTGSRQASQAPARGERIEQVPVHSLRLSSFIARHDAVFSGPGERLILHHEVVDRSCFIPGVILACRRLAGTGRFVYGLENLMGI